ncbi:hypothetical protein IKF81_02285 [Candidatus Saccharibacteria bacterium]|nr:hypothetical protein [Candidatus Saccharibacteria bacterium]
MDDFQKLVYVRWQSMPKGYSISIGDKGIVTKEEALEHVANNDEIGRLLIAIDRNYFDEIKTGKIYEHLNYES